MNKFFVVVIVLTIHSVLHAQTKGFSIVERKDNKQVDILFNGKLMTAYCFYDSSRKPFLFPVNTVDGITITRGYPFRIVPGERTDHPHHTGIWLNYESVNGLDFWNNSTAIAVEKRNLYGTIGHLGVTNQKANGNTASITATAKWMRPDHKVLLDEQTTYRFSIQGNDFIIDRTTTLTATDTHVFCSKT